MADEEKQTSFEKKLKEGISIQEIENIARRYTNEVLLILALIIATISSIFDFFVGPGSTIFFMGLCAILSIAFPERIIQWQKRLYQFIYKQEKITQISIGIVRIILALFLPFILFAELGLLAGIGFHIFSKKMLTSKEVQPVEEKEEDK